MQSKEEKKIASRKARVKYEKSPKGKTTIGIYRKTHKKEKKKVSAERYKNNKEEIKKVTAEYQKSPKGKEVQRKARAKYYKTPNGKTVCDKGTAKYQKSPKGKETKGIYRRNHKEEIAEYSKTPKRKKQKAEYEKTPKCRTARRKQNAKFRKTPKGKLKGMIDRQKRRALKFLTPKKVTITTVEIKELIDNAIYCPHCKKVFCEHLFMKKSLDHIIPLSKGGLHSKSNCQILCLSCNHSKNNKLQSEVIK